MPGRGSDRSNAKVIPLCANAFPVFAATAQGINASGAAAWRTERRLTERVPGVWSRCSAFPRTVCRPGRVEIAGELPRG